MNPTYITTNLDKVTELIDNSKPEIKDLIYGDEVNSTTATLGKIYKIPISHYVALSNIITYILIGALLPENVVRALKDILKMEEGDAIKMAGDLDKSILEKARIVILGKKDAEMKTIILGNGQNPDELRKEILDTTKRAAEPLP